MENYISELMAIQNELKVPRTKKNGAKYYAFRSTEDILANVKPLLKMYQCTIDIDEEIVERTGATYFCAIATFTNSKGDTKSCKAFAKEPNTPQGKNTAQESGCTSSYARKRALGGLLLLDDTVDADMVAQEEDEQYLDVLNAVMCCYKKEELQQLYFKNKKNWDKNPKIISLINKRRGEIENA